jgi:tetratricopeptide (TPR) repeat protein
MAHSLRRPAGEPVGSFVHPASGTTFTVHSEQDGLWQRIERDGYVSEYHVEYVVGSGNHASGYLVRIGDHLFQSPICFYTRYGRYDMAPGSEDTRNPDFIRPVTEECLLCHSGKPLHLKNTLNEYESPAFAQESISCARCHGNPTRHLKAPLPGSIVNPAKLSVAARNSVCEQCHLKGEARVLNPGNSFEDFHPGMPLEEVFTIYTAAIPPGSPREAIKVISQAEELALSLCARKSNGRLWCGTCHDPHSSAKQPAGYYNARCLTCHEASLASARHSRESGNLTAERTNLDPRFRGSDHSRSHLDGAQGDCIGCHMTKQNAKDGGHTVFTDHCISRRPVPAQEGTPPSAGELVAWREPPAALRERNQALAYVEAGIETESASEMARGRQMLTEVEKRFPDDTDVVTALAKALLRMNQTLEAARLFERALALGPVSAVAEEDAGRAWMQSGELDKALDHFEQAVKADPLLLPAAEGLMKIYRQRGETKKLSELGERVGEALGPSAPQQASAPGP